MITKFKAFLALSLFSSVLFAAPQVSSAAVLTFEGLLDLEVVTNQFAAQNAVFTNATAGIIPSSGGTLNDVDFPPVSGVTAVSNEIDTDSDGIPDDLGSIEIKFSSYPVESVSGYFTYGDFSFTGDPLTLHAFGPLDPINPISTLTLIENIGSPTLLSFSGIGPIASIFAFGGFGSYFTLDDLDVGNRFVSPGSTVVPEPSTFALLALGLIAVAGRSRFKA